MKGCVAVTRPLCVALDGTLIRSDLLLEAVLTLLREKPLSIFVFPFWWWKGRSYFEQRIAERVEIDARLLPYNELFLDYLRSEKATGRRVILATRADIRLATQVGAHLGFFDEILASDEKADFFENLVRDRLVSAFGKGGFDYAANAARDIPIWRVAGAAVLVGETAGLAARVGAITRVSRVFPAPKSGWSTYLRAVRPHHWLKNLLVFLPLLAAHELGDLTRVLQGMLAFIAFGLCASSVYLVNDLLDLKNDRQHSIKRARPFAAGEIPIQHGIYLALFLLAAAFGAAILLPPAFLAVLVAYYSATLVYSLRLKKIVLVDVMVLAGVYILRVIAGGVATDIFPSFWLLAFSMFTFFSLALVKRYSELRLVETAQEKRAPGRGYQTTDIDTLSQFGIASGYAAVLVLALYINSDTVVRIYRHPELLWLIVPLFLYWINRIWLLARRGLTFEDPILSAVADKQSQVIVLATVFILGAASA